MHNGVLRNVGTSTDGLVIPALVEGYSREELQLQNIVVAAWNSFATEVDITEFVKKTRWSPKRILACVRDAHHNHPEVFFLAPGINLEVIKYPDGTLVKAVLRDLKYDQTPSEYRVRKRMLDAAVHEAMETLDGVDGDANRALQLHDHLVRICDYDMTARGEKIYSTRARTAYSALVRRRAVCSGYAYAYRLLLNAVGIVSDYAISESHIWNYVKIDGKWHHVDVTWDGPIYIGGGSRENKISHRHFLMSDQKALMTGHKAWYVRGLSSFDDLCCDYQPEWR